MENFNLNEIKDAVDAIKSGQPVILVDSTDREFEGDLVVAAQKVNIYNLQFCSLTVGV